MLIEGLDLWGLWLGPGPIVHGSTNIGYGLSGWMWVRRRNHCMIKACQ